MAAETHPWHGNSVLLGKLTFWTEQLMRIDVESRRVSCQLADTGVLPAAPVEVGPGDSPGTVRLKESLIRLKRRKKALLAEMAAIDAVIVDDETLEITVPGGPENNTFLSWIPGEPTIAYWRKSPDTSCERHPLEDARFPENHHLWH